MEVSEKQSSDEAGLLKFFEENSKMVKENFDDSSNNGEKKANDNDNKGDSECLGEETSSHVEGDRQKSDQDREITCVTDINSNMTSSQVVSPVLALKINSRVSENSDVLDSNNTENVTVKNGCNTDGSISTATVDQSMDVGNSKYVSGDINREEEVCITLDVDKHPDVKSDSEKNDVIPTAESKICDDTQKLDADAAVSTLMDYRMVSDGDDSSDESTTSSIELSVSSEEEFEKKEKDTQKESRIVKTKGEFSILDLPPIEELAITVDENVDMVKIGRVSGIVESLVVIQAERDTPALNMDTILFLEEKKVLGQIFETFGPVPTPFYSVRFNSVEQINERGITIGLPVFYAPRVSEFTKYVFLEQLRRMKGSDASWEHNNEPPEKFLEYSDDEAERDARRGNRKDGAGDDGGTEGNRRKRRGRNRNQRNTDRSKSDGQGQSWPPRGPSAWTPPPGPRPPPLPRSVFSGRPDNTGRRFGPGQGSNAPGYRGRFDGPVRYRPPCNTARPPYQPPPVTARPHGGFGDWNKPPPPPGPGHMEDSLPRGPSPSTFVPNPAEQDSRQRNFSCNGQVQQNFYPDGSVNPMFSSQGTVPQNCPQMGPPHAANPLQSFPQQSCSQRPPPVPQNLPPSQPPQQAPLGPPGGGSNCFATPSPRPQNIWETNYPAPSAGNNSFPTGPCPPMCSHSRPAPSSVPPAQDCRPPCVDGSGFNVRPPHHQPPGFNQQGPPPSWETSRPPGPPTSYQNFTPMDSRPAPNMDSRNNQMCFSGAQQGPPPSWQGNPCHQTAPPPCSGQTAPHQFGGPPRFARQTAPFAAPPRWQSS